MRKIHREIVGAFIFSADRKLLVGKSQKGGVYSDVWIIPGGGIDEGETRLQALIRETIEETGIDVSSSKIEEIPGELTGESEKTLRDTGERVLVEMTFYNFRVDLLDNAEDILVKTEDDFVDAKWVSASELKNFTLSPPTTTTLQRLGLI